MLESFTAGALRAIRRSEARARSRGASLVEPEDLITALVDESESHAATLLREFGLDPALLFVALGQPESPPDDDALDTAPIPLSADVRALFSEASHQARAFDRSRQVGTDDLLAILLAGPAGAIFDGTGLDLDGLRARLTNQAASETGPIPLDADIPPLDLSDPGEAIELGRILDASANRAREGLRVVEDYVRFVLDDPALTRRLKEVRHRLADALKGIDPDLLIGSRDTRGDVGTHIMTAAESTRENPRAVLTANFKRTAEALRTLEEYGKLLDSWVAGRFEVLRYDVYTLEKLTLTAARSHWTLADSRLMVLVGGLPTLGDLTWIVGEALAGGADAIQLREKGIDDREWLRRAREVRILTAQAKARFLVNDRPDLARLAGADGVHLGQDDMTVRDARRIVGPTALVGVSTHDPAQLDKAILDAAGYLGVGPVFTSSTKAFGSFAGLDFVRHAAESTTLPWFAIGGIDESTIDEVLEAGATRVAVSAAVVRAEYPRKAAAALRARLDAI
jgi:thiamine-phosphate pyrophosphorylase